jgi:capsule biosynthesis phosphatase
MRIFVDLDHTLCFPDESFGQHRDKYRYATPNAEIISRVNKWHHQGHEIVIYTARRMKTHNGDTALVEEDIGQLTRNWLAEHRVSYDELLFGKPYYDMLIDDKTCLPEIEAIENTILSGKLPEL